MLRHPEQSEGPAFYSRCDVVEGTEEKQVLRSAQDDAS
jgi:hypothetical protein